LSSFTRFSESVGQKSKQEKATTTTMLAMAAVKLFNCHPPALWHTKNASIMPYINKHAHKYITIYINTYIHIYIHMLVCVCGNRREGGVGVCCGVALILACIKCALGGCFRSRSAIFIFLYLYLFIFHFSFFAAIL